MQFLYKCVAIQCNPCAYACKRFVMSNHKINLLYQFSSMLLINQKVTSMLLINQTFITMLLINQTVITIQKSVLRNSRITIQGVLWRKPEIKLSLHLPLQPCNSSDFLCNILGIVRSHELLHSCLHLYGHRAISCLGSLEEIGANPYNGCVEIVRTF